MRRQKKTIECKGDGGSEMKLPVEACEGGLEKKTLIKSIKCEL